MKKVALIASAALIFFLLQGCQQPVPSDDGVADLSETDTETKDQLSIEIPLLIDQQTLLDHIKTLSSDEFEGRGPSSIGEEKTLQYLKQQFDSLELEPVYNSDYRQQVPMVSLTANDPFMMLGDQVLTFKDDFVAWTNRVVKQSSVKDSPMVFVGYGIVAPEYQWNDYAGIDVRGKTVIMLINDPGYATQDPNLFKGNAMTYYGRWTYKFEEAARQGAAAAIIIHKTEPASYGWNTVRNSWSGTRFNLIADNNHLDKVAIESWITWEQGLNLFKQNGLDLDALALQAQQPGFKSVPLNTEMTAQLGNTIALTDSNNVIAMIEGSEKPEEVIIYTAHWDHIGIHHDEPGDNIYNGARDNATGVAALIEMARLFRNQAQPPKRTVVFAAIAAEEQGLFGSEWFANNMPWPDKNVIANINMDGLNIFSPTWDVEIVGYGQSEMDQLLMEQAQKQGRRAIANGSPERGGFFRSDHFHFAKKGIPALFMSMGSTSRLDNQAWMDEKLTDYSRNKYHQPGDEVEDWWTMVPAIEDVQLLYGLGSKLSQSDIRPQWHDGSEFKLVRQASEAE